MISLGVLCLLAFNNSVYTEWMSLYVHIEPYQACEDSTGEQVLNIVCDYYDNHQYLSFELNPYCNYTLPKITLVKAIKKSNK